MTTEPVLSTGSVCLRLPGGDSLPGLLERTEPVPATPTRLPDLDGAEPTNTTDTTEIAVATVAEPGLPESIPRRKLHDLGRETLLAVGAAGEVRAGLPSGEGVGLVWASANSGLEEYVQLCHEASVLEPGLTRPTLGPRSAFNGPCADLSILFGLTGPQLTVIGGPAAGASAVIEAQVLITDGQCDRVLVGGSVAVNRWTLLARTGAEATPAEGALGLVIERPAGDGTSDSPRISRYLRTTWGTERARERLRALVDSGTEVVLSGIEPGALADLGPRVVRQVEQVAGDLGAAGGVLAVALAAELVTRGSSRCVAVAADPGGSLTAVELSRGGR